MGERVVRKNVKRLEAKILSEKATGKSGKLSDVPEEAPAQSSWGFDFLFGGGTQEKVDEVAFSRNSKADGSSVLSDWDLNDDRRMDSKELTHLQRNDSEKHERVMAADRDGDGERTTGETWGWGREIHRFVDVGHASPRVFSASFFFPTPWNADLLVSVCTST